MKFLLFILLYPATLLFTKSFAQQIPRDTSFTIHSTFLREKAQYPFIEVADPSPSHVDIRNDVVYRTVGNRKLYADVYCPQQSGRSRFPAVVMVHGGGWRSGDKSQCRAMAIGLAEKGYVAVAAEYRLSLEAPYPAAVHDLKAAIRWIRAHAKRYKVDASKIAILGFSAGGQLAALVGTARDDAFAPEGIERSPVSSDVQAIVDVDGILAFHHPESAEGAVAAAWLGGTYAEKPAVWDTASALYHVGPHSPPMLFVNSSYVRFHAGRDQVIEKLNKFGTYSHVFTFPDTPHPFWFFHPWFQPTVDVTVQFLDRVLKGSDNNARAQKRSRITPFFHRREVGAHAFQWGFSLVRLLLDDEV